MSDVFERAAARCEPPCAPSCPRADGVAQYLLARTTAQRRHQRIVFAEDVLRLFTPAAVMTGVLAAFAPKAALAAGTAFVVAQHSAAALGGMLQPRLPDSVDAALESMPLGVGALAAIVAGLAVVPGGDPMWPAYAALTGLALMFWPSAFHRWRGARLTDFERMGTLEAQCRCACA